MGTDTNCGGACPQPCAVGMSCVVAADCQSLNCMGGTCVAASCTDGIQDGTETDTDCGGGACLPCADDSHCKMTSDCIDKVCSGTPLTCQAPTCHDGVQNGTETAADCGGSACLPCVDGDTCKVGSDCIDKVCSKTLLTCSAPTCHDGVTNGTETDVDCGGTMCLPCHPGQMCKTGSDCAGGSCSGTCQCPSGMVVAPIQGGGIYCIDATEVSYGQYQTFYNANVPTGSQDPFCTWNTNWTPADNWPQPNGSTVPVSYVNWCQAAAYCKYVGRRLCGQIGGGSVAQASYADFTKDQWFNACTAGGANVYPYGSAYKPTTCNGADIVDGGLPGPESYFSLESCLGGETGLLEMSGNVAEWEDACDASTGNIDNCLVRGGSYEDHAQGLECNSGGTAVSQERSYQGSDVGFRCCL